MCQCITQSSILIKNMSFGGLGSLLVCLELSDIACCLECLVRMLGLLFEGGYNLKKLAGRAALAGYSDIVNSR